MPKDEAAEYRAEQDATNKSLSDAQTRSDRSRKRGDDAIKEMGRLDVLNEDRITADNERRKADDGRREADDVRRGADDDRRAADDRRREQPPSSGS